MMNPPFPYNVVIRRDIANADPFVESEDATEIVYDGVCDYENNRFPITKDGVQIGKYKLYIPDNKVFIEKRDLIELSIHNKVIAGEVLDYFPTNFGTTVTWDSKEN